MAKRRSGILNRGAIGLAALMSLGGGSVAFSQESATRAEADRQRREEKQKQAEPYKPGRVERAMRLVEEKQVFLSGREGVYPKLGSLTTGSGFAYGAGYRDSDLFKNYGTLDVWAATSLRRYWATEARLIFPKLARKRLHVEAWAAHRDYPQEDFFGLGPDSNRDDETSYAIQTNYFGGRIGVRPAPIVMAGGGVEYMTPKLGVGKDDRVPSIERLFNPSTAPGLGGSVNYVHSDAFVEIDYRQPKNPRKGGFYRVDLSRFDDQTSGQYTFFRVDTDLRQYVGFLEGRRVVSARLFVSTSDAGADQTIPFYLMPTLGGNDTLRGFRQYRFRGPQALLAQGEYRWEIWSGLEGALFYDAGKVANVRSDLNFQDLETDYGFGFRFNTDNAVVFRVDAGFGSRDGKHLYMVFGGVF